MFNFTFYNPTTIYFGRGQIEALEAELRARADKVLVVTGAGSVKKNGIFDEVVKQVEASTPSHPTYKKSVTKSIEEAEKWIAEAKEKLKIEERVSNMPALDNSTRPLLNWMDPANKHNAMIAGLVPYRIRGSIWYQGEANHTEDMIYVKKTKALVEVVIDMMPFTVLDTILIWSIFRTMMSPLTMTFIMVQSSPSFICN